jgi:hypothetical protein
MKNAKHLVVVLGLTASGSLAACATPKAPSEPLPAEVAQRLETVRRERTDYPSFADIPPPPQNLRTPPEWAQAVQAVETRGAVVGSWPARNPAWVTNPEGDAARLQALTRVDPALIPPPDQGQRTEAFAESLRQQLNPPPPIED